MSPAVVLGPVARASVRIVGNILYLSLNCVRHGFPGVVTLVYSAVVSALITSVGAVGVAWVLPVVLRFGLPWVLPRLGSRLLPSVVLAVAFLVTSRLCPWVPLWGVRGRRRG